MLKPINLFYTPSSMEEMQEIIDQLPARDRAMVYSYVMQMYNLLVSKIVVKNEAQS